MQAKWARRRMQRGMVERFHRKYGPFRDAVRDHPWPLYVVVRGGIRRREYHPVIPDNLVPVFTRSRPQNWMTCLASLPKFAGMPSSIWAQPGEPTASRSAAPADSFDQAYSHALSLPIGL